MKAVGTQTYSFRSTQRVFGTAFHAGTPESAALSAIEDALMKGHAHYLAGRYQDAIHDYQRAAALVYAQLHPAGGRPLEAVPAPQALRAAAVPEPGVDESPPADRPDRHITPTGRGHGRDDRRGGWARPRRFRSELVDAAQNADAIADWQLAKTLTAQSNRLAAQVFLDRAQREAPELIGQLQERPGEAPLAGPPRVQRAAPGLLAETDAAPSMPRADIPAGLTVERSYGVVIDEEVKQVKWRVGDAPDLGQVTELLYDFRLVAVEIPPLLFAPQQPSDLPLWLPHAYYYVVPLGLAECYHGLGEFETAEQYYLEAAGYEFLNAEVEAPYIWQRLATLYLDAGNSRFREDDPDGALPHYAKVIGADDSEPASPLYTVAGLAPAAAMARTVLANLTAPETLEVNQGIAAVIIEVRQQLQKIAGELDFWGFWTGTVPIWTFEYLQNVAASFAQLAIGAERDVINFWDRAGSGNLTRAQLQQGVTVSAAEVQTATLQAGATRAEAAAYAAAGGTRQGARRQRQHLGGRLHRQVQPRHPLSGFLRPGQRRRRRRSRPAQRAGRHAAPGNAIRGSRATIAAATQLAAAKANREYEIGASSARPRRWPSPGCRPTARSSQPTPGRGRRLGRDRRPPPSAGRDRDARRATRPSSSPPRCGSAWATPCTASTAATSTWPSAPLASCSRRTTSRPTRPSASSGATTAPTR